MEYKVIIERRDGMYHAFIPLLPNITAEGATRDLALARVWSEAEQYLAQVEVTTIEIQQRFRPDSPQAWLRAAADNRLDPDDELVRQYFADMEAEKQRQREEAEREADLAEVGSATQ